jgi:adenylosuccinate synthase
MAAEALWLKPYLVDVSAEINEGVDRGKKVLIEGTQGFGLSLYHSPAYPKTTSRDTSAAGCISECGISPMLVTNVVLVMRTYPIRVAGQQAGPMFEEIDWETVQLESGYPHKIAEFTTVTGKLRRVGRFDYELAKRAVMVNRPTALALNFLDYVSAENTSVRSAGCLTESAQWMMSRIQNELKVPIAYGGVGPTVAETFSIPRQALTRNTLVG